LLGTIKFDKNELSLWNCTSKQCAGVSYRTVLDVRPHLGLYEKNHIFKKLLSGEFFTGPLPYEPTKSRKAEAGSP